MQVRMLLKFDVLFNIPVFSHEAALNVQLRAAVHDQ